MVRLSGDAARVLKDGRHIGNVYRWRFEGTHDDWRATAEKYRLAEEIDGDVEFCFFLGQIEIGAVGRFADGCIADGTVHRETVALRGFRSWIHQPIASNSPLAAG